MRNRTAPLYRLFFALKPPPMVARRIDHFAETIAPGQTRILIDHHHVTLGITADRTDYPYEQVKALRRAALGIKAEPFDLTLDHLSFSARSAALRPAKAITGLKRLQEQIAAAMRRAEVGERPEWSFSPHQTLFYRDGRPDQQRIDGFGWRAEEVVLVCSHVGLTRHEILGSWRLEGDGQYRLF